MSRFTSNRSDTAEGGIRPDEVIDNQLFRQPTADSFTNELSG